MALLAALPPDSDECAGENDGMLLMRIRMMTIMMTMRPASLSTPPLIPVALLLPNLLRWTGEEEAMTESQQLVQDLANVKRSVGPLVRCP